MNVKWKEYAVVFVGPVVGLLLSGLAAIFLAWSCQQQIEADERFEWRRIGPLCGCAFEKKIDDYNFLYMCAEHREEWSGSAPSHVSNVCRDGDPDRRSK